MSMKLNLLPDVRLAKLRDQQHRRLAVSVAIGSVVVTAALLVVGVLIVQGQYLTIHSLTSGIKSREDKVSSYPNVKAMLSTQGRLAALPDLYAKRQTMTNVYQVLSSIQPSDVAFTSVTLDSSNLLTINATGRSYLAAARIARALEQDNLTVGNGASSSNTPHFSNVQLSAVTLSTGVTTFSITATISSGVLHGK